MSMKATAFADLVAIMSKPKVTIKEVVTSAKRSAVDDLQKYYNIILTDWDTAKAYCW